MEVFAHVPAEVETPAPVNTMKCLLFLMRATSSSACWSMTSGASRRSGGATLGAEEAIASKNVNFITFAVARIVKENGVYSRKTRNREFAYISRQPPRYKNN